MVTLPLPAANGDVKGHEPFAVTLIKQLGRGDLQTAGLLMVAAMLWTGLKRGGMRLSKDASLRFVRSVDRRNPATVVAEAWGGELLCPGSDYRGRRVNLWEPPEWSTGRTVAYRMLVRPLQAKRWRCRARILVKASDRGNPVAAVVRETLSVVDEAPEFAGIISSLAPAEARSVVCFRASPTKLTVTKEGDISTAVGRLPKRARQALLLAGMRVIELDVSSAHVVLLGRLYEGIDHPEVDRERVRFVEASKDGFAGLYGPDKCQKAKFLAALNQLTTRARWSSIAYREFVAQFPLLGREMERVKRSNSKALGEKLRHWLAVIMGQAVMHCADSGIYVVPVTDSLLCAVPDEADERDSVIREVATAIGQRLADFAGCFVRVKGSDGSSFVFSPGPAVEPGHPMEGEASA